MQNFSSIITIIFCFSFLIGFQKQAQTSKIESRKNLSSEPMGQDSKASRAKLDLSISI